MVRGLIEGWQLVGDTMCLPFMGNSSLRVRAPEAANDLWLAEIYEVDFSSKSNNHDPS